MKGGRTAPRKYQQIDSLSALVNTSMKGGRTAPRKLHSWSLTAGGRFYFNEGGADCPPKVGCSGEVVETWRPTSMKGGRTAPRKFPFGYTTESLRTTSMKGGRTAPRKRSGKM